MKPALLSLLAGVLLVGAVAFSRPGDKPGLKIASDKRNPWTHLKLNNDPYEFQFAIVSDRTGGHREKVFDRAMARLNLLQPEFVVSVGDLIEGGRLKPKEKLIEEWKEFDSYVNKLTMPFFYVPGNHDIGSKLGDALWQERYGRRWYHFVYRDVLFLCLNSEDGAPNNMGNEQIAYVKKVLGEIKDVRHTLVFLHKPIWTAPDVAKRGWLEVEKALADRPYTVFCGHVHRYRKFVRQGRNYYQLATTGGGSKLRGLEYGEFDHIVWVTMKKDGPVLANVMLDSILPDDLQVPESQEKGAKPPVGLTRPAKLTLYYQGTPLVGAYVQLVPKERGKGFNADGLTEGDGTLIPSTFSPMDGMIPGLYQVAVTQRRPLYLPDGSLGPNLLPEKYASASQSGLLVEITNSGANEVRLDLD
jgi:Icc-related predicted phosphoesterase